MSELDRIVFFLGDVPVSLAMALIAGGAIVLLAALVLLVQWARGNQRRAEAAGQDVIDTLRTGFHEQVAARDARISELELRLERERDRALEQLAGERDRSTGLQSELAAMRTRLDEQARQNELNLKRFTEARQQMTDEFKAIAGDVLRSHSETFTKQNREQVDTLLKPLNDKLVEFQGELARDSASMKEQIRALAESSLQMQTEAGNLTRALKGSSQAQGAWGEMILSSILERSGLREGEQFVTQTSHTNEDGARVRTDVEVLMPNDDRLIIDSKVSLTAFAAYTSGEDEDRDVHLAAHIASIRNHVRTLGDKTYQRHARSKLDFVMMFVPIESALATAIQHDAQLVEYAMGRGVMLTTPTTLMTVLRTVRNVWDIEKRHQNAEEIAARAGALYDKVAGFLGSMDKLETHLERARQSYDDAKGQLATGRGSLVRQVEMLRNLGAKSSKALPAGWDGGEDEPPALRLVKDEPGDLA